MNFAIPSNRPFVSKSPVKTHKKLSADMVELMKWCETHKVAIVVDPVTKEGKAIITEHNGNK